MLRALHQNRLAGGLSERNSLKALTLRRYFCRPAAADLLCFRASRTSVAVVRAPCCLEIPLNTTTPARDMTNVDGYAVS